MVLLIQGALKGSLIKNHISSIRYDTNVINIVAVSLQRFLQLICYEIWG